MREPDSPSQHPRAALAAAVAHAEHRDNQARQVERVRRDGLAEPPEAVPARVNDLIGVSQYVVTLALMLAGIGLSALLARALGGVPGELWSDVVFHVGSLISTIGAIATGHAVRRMQLRRIAQQSAPPALPSPGAASAGGAPVVVPALKDDERTR